MTQLSDLRRLVRQRLGVPTGDDFFTDPVLTDLVNAAINTIEEEHYWPWAEVIDPAASLTAGQSTLTKPARWRATRALFNGPDELTLVPITDLLNVAPATVGTPTAWTDTGAGIRVAPAPSGPLTLIHVYYQAPVDLVADTDTPDLPSSMSDAIVCKAAELGSAREDDQPARTAHGNDYAKWMQRMLRAQRRSTGPLRVRVRPGGWI